MKSSLLTLLCLPLFLVHTLVAEIPGNVIQVGSVWKCDGPQSLTITEREGEKFRGLFTFAAKELVKVEVSGEVKGNQISWLAKDVHAPNPGGDNTGTINGDRIDFKWRRKDNKMSGAFTLVHAADVSAPITPESVALGETLVAYKWAWSNPSQVENTWTEVQFMPDGTLLPLKGIGNYARSARWRISSATTIELDEKTLRFDPALTSFAGVNGKGGRFTGTRKESLASAVPKPLAMTSVTPAAIQTSDDQPRIAVLKEQAPNVIEWALAPLDQAVPGDIRQNLTFLREDLLDEGKQKSKASPEAYALGTQLCNTLLAVLAERTQTLARAGFRGVEANIRTGVTSQALDARRNYKMSWPQFAREESQRAELKQQALNGAAVIAERPKLDWVDRTSSLRQTIEPLYARFRAALREGEN